MAEKHKADPTEEAHFRIDEHERRLHALDRAMAPETVAAVAQGAVATLTAQLEKRVVNEIASLTERLVKAVREDVQSDQALTQALGELVAQLRAQKAPEAPDLTEVRELARELREFVAMLKTPTTRTATLQLPSGPATMTVRETRQ